MMADNLEAVAVVTESSEPLGVKVQLVERNDAPMGMQLVNAYAVNRSADPMDLVALAQQVQQADEFTRATCGSKLTAIADQIKYLQQQAKKVLEDAKRDHELHHAACNLVKKPGHMYYLYRRQSGQACFSLISPQEWGASCPHEYLDAYRLEYDQSWTPLKHLDKRSSEIALVDRIVNQQLAIVDSENVLGVNGSVKLQEVQTAHK